MCITCRNQFDCLGGDLKRNCERKMENNNITLFRQAVPAVEAICKPGMTRNLNFNTDKNFDFSIDRKTTKNVLKGSGKSYKAAKEKNVLIKVEYKYEMLGKYDLARAFKGDICLDAKGANKVTFTYQGVSLLECTVLLNPVPGDIPSKCSGQAGRLSRETIDIKVEDRSRLQQFCLKNKAIEKVGVDVTASEGRVEVKNFHIKACEINNLKLRLLSGEFKLNQLKKLNEY